MRVAERVDAGKNAFGSALITLSAFALNDIILPLSSTAAAPIPIHLSQFLVTWRGIIAYDAVGSIDLISTAGRFSFMVSISGDFAY